MADVSSVRPIAVILGVVATVVSAPLLAGGAASAATAPTPHLDSPAGLTGGAAAPRSADPAGTYVPQTSCDPTEKPGITRFKTLVLSQYPVGEDWGSFRNCTDDGISEHLEGRAWDWHVDVTNPEQFAAAGNVLQWLTQRGPDGKLGYNARRLGVMYLGYNHRIWASYRMQSGWRVLKNDNPHTDHVHFSFTWAGAMARTSFWTGHKAAPDFGPCRPYKGQPAVLRTMRRAHPCPTPPALPKRFAGAQLLWRGSSGPLVTRAQELLGATPTGVFGSQTQAAVAEYQVARGLPRTGAVDARTYYSLHLKTGGAVSPAKSSTLSNRRGTR